LFSYVILFIRNYVFWWGLFILYTIVALIKLKLYSSPSYVLALYFFIQEAIGVLFIIRISFKIQFLAILLKGGFSPFHGWLGMVFNQGNGSAVIWLLTWQKLPYYFSISLFLTWYTILFILLLRILPLIQCILNMSSKVILFLVLTSSSNVFIILFYFFFNFCLLITPFYLYILYSIFGIYGRKMIRIGLESNFVIIRIPGSLPFYMKMLLIGELSPNGGLFFIYFYV